MQYTLTLDDFKDLQGTNLMTVPTRKPPVEFKKTAPHSHVIQDM